jgi:hypothetical protein
MIQPFQIFEWDGVTAVNLTGMTLTWRFKDNTVTPATVKNIVGSITDTVNGKCSFTIPQSFFTVVTKYECQIELSQSGVILEHTDPYFDVEILQSQT